MQKTFFLMIFALMGLTVVPVVAQSNPMNPEAKAGFEEFLGSNAYRIFADRAFNLVEPAPLRAQCPHMTMIIEQTSLYTPLTEVVLSGTSPDRRIIAGAWVSVANFDRCGTRVRRRALMKVDDKGAILPIRLLPGDFRGDLVLERDAIRIVYPALLASAGCSDSKQFFVSDVARKETKPNGDWIEVWTAEACGKDIAADVSYDRHGDVIVIAAQNVR